MEYVNSQTNKVNEFILKVQGLEEIEKLLKEEIENLSKKIQEYSEEMKDLSAKKEGMLANIDQHKELHEIIESLKNENDILKNELTRVSQIAYCDPKFGTYNLNAFHGRLFGPERNPMAVAIVDVLNMKKINEEYDEETGDGVIRYTVKALHDMFGIENVFRIRGAQFGIVIDDGDYVRIKHMLKEVAETLYEIKEFEVEYGHATINRYPSREDAYKAAKEELMKKKKERGTEENGSEFYVPPVMEMNQNVYAQMGMPMVSPVVSTPIGSYEVPKVTAVEKKIVESEEKVQEIPKQTNPNISKSIYKDVYAEAENIIEVDSTSIDLALEIINMQTKK